MSGQDPKPYRGKYQSGSTAPFMVSRTKIEDFVRCPLCFVLDRKFQVSRPSIPAFTLNSAVDSLLKKEFDEHRSTQTVHPALLELGFDFVPLQHPDIEKWRSNFVGVSLYYEPTNFHLFGALDDVWLARNGDLVVVDYKATAKAEPVTKLSSEEWHMAYRRQIEFYQWLLASNGFKVAESGYWLYATARNNLNQFDRKLVFDLRLIEHPGDYSWVEPTILAAKAALDSDSLPSPSDNCEFCIYSSSRFSVVDAKP